jgi:hypothetical protein
LPIAVVPHPFGNRTRSEVRALAEACVGDVVRLLCGAGEALAETYGAEVKSGAAQFLRVPDDEQQMNRLFFERGWSDGLPIVAPTRERVEAMLACTKRAPDEVIANIAPGFGAATVERIAVNAVMAGCYPEYLPVLIGAAEAVSTREFNLSGVQATTNPAAVWLIINGPMANQLGVNGGANCLGPGAWANATLGRALRLILQNVGGGRPGEMDRATHGQPGKYTFCCAENEAMNPWTPLHVERGFDVSASTVTVVAPLGTWNMNTHAKDADDLIRVMGDTMAFPVSSDYVHGGAPWLLLAPEHAQILSNAGLGKPDVKRRLWDASKLAASRLAARDLGRVQTARAAELGAITAETMLPISVAPDDVNFIVAGGEGTHSVYIPVSGYSFSVTREIRD